MNNHPPVETPALFRLLCFHLLTLPPGPRSALGREKLTTDCVISSAHGRPVIINYAAIWCWIFGPDHKLGRLPCGDTTGCRCVGAGTGLLEPCFWIVINIKWIELNSVFEKLFQVITVVPRDHSYATWSQVCHVITVSSRDQLRHVITVVPGDQLCLNYK